MPAARKRYLKGLLKKEIEQKAKENRKYFTREELRSFGPDRRFNTLNRYMVGFNKAGILYGAGRGWYSFVKQPLKLDRRPVKKVIAMIAKKYPLLSFTVWSTEQLKTFAHHMPTRFVTFVYVDRDATSGIYDFLRDTGYDTWLNPRGSEARKFNVGDKTAVIRPAISRECSNGHFAEIEKILVDLFVEVADLNLMDEGEYYRILDHILAAGRINISALLNYARRRRLRPEKFAERIKSI